MAEIARAVGGKPIEVWFADEARVGQKNTITRRWTKRGTRPSAPKDQRTASAYIFGAICPARGTGAGLVMPRCTTEAMPYATSLSDDEWGGACADSTGAVQHRPLVAPATALSR